jgi:hypothetical protein
LIKLWKTNPNGSPKLFTIILSPVLYHPIWGNDALKLVEREKIIISRLSKYLDIWKVGKLCKFHIQNEDETVCGILGRYFVRFVKQLLP